MATLRLFQFNFLFLSHHNGVLTLCLRLRTATIWLELRSSTSRTITIPITTWASTLMNNNVLITVAPSTYCSRCVGSSGKWILMSCFCCELHRETKRKPPQDMVLWNHSKMRSEKNSARFLFIRLVQHQLSWRLFWRPQIKRQRLHQHQRLFGRLY